MLRKKAHILWEANKVKQYRMHYDSPLGGMLAVADDEGLIGLWFEGQKYFAPQLCADCALQETPVLQMTRRWLDLYFSGKEPDFFPPLHLQGSAFRMAVWALLQQIPYGRVVTYGAIARKFATQRGLTQMSAQAVGGAVGHNPISILVPCHRVIGTDGSLTGYAGGLEKKRALLTLEGIKIEDKRNNCVFFKTELEF